MAAASSTPLWHYSTKISVERFSFYAALKYGLVGSLLLDLVLQGKLEIDNNNRVIGAIAGNTGNEFLDQRFSKVLASSRPRTARFWITRAIAQGELVGKAVSKAIFIIQATALLSAVNVR